MPVCPTCGDTAEHAVYENESAEFPAGPEIRVCHADTGAYIHVIGDE
jgi:hypothetical protein